MKLSGTYHLSTTAAVILILTALTLIPATGTAQTVLTGIDVLEANGFEQLQGKRIGLVTNPTGVDRYLNSTIDVLHSAPGVELVALFGPEHGVRGNAHAGEHVEGQAVDPRTGVPIFSLYGKTRLPSAEQFEGLDAIVYDIQDIGCRSYTYISTMGNVMKVAAMDIPYIYGLTPGELATLLNEEGMLSVKGSDGRDSTVKCRLTVVKMEGWKRGMNFDATGLLWVPSSPHIPTVEAAYLYPATGILGELGTVSIGVGYTLPFGMIAREGMNADLLASRLNSLCLPGILFRPIYATPFYGSLKGREIGGVQIYITDFGAARLSEIQFYVMQVLRELDPTFGPFAKASASQLEMFDKVTGSKEVRRVFGERYRYEDIFSIWNDFADKFRDVSKKYYLYGL